MAKRVGLLGGTFDPPHHGHLIMAEVARVSCGLDEVRFLVAGDPWMKQETTATVHRLAMAGLTVEDQAEFTLDDRETRRSGPTYTVDTLEELESQEPDTSWFFIIGADQLESLDEWHEIDRCLELATFVVAPRPGYEYASHDNVVPLDAPYIDLSSTDLRARFQENRAVRYQLPRDVEHYIRNHGLYGASHEP